MSKTPTGLPRKRFGLSFDRELWRDIQRLGIEEDKFTNELLEEAARDLLKKYREKNKALPKGKG